VLELRGLTKVYRDTQTREAWPVANDLSLSVSRAQTVALLGPSGSGKSTLLRVIAGLEPVDAGRVYFDGQDITDLPPERRGFALMFQDFALFPHLDVLDNVGFGLRERAVTRRDARAQALVWLQRLGLSHRVSAPVLRLSGGEQQRVALARALIIQPRLLLLDEPFSALDAALRVQLRQILVRELARSRTPCLWVTHDEAEAQEMADHAWRLSQGQLQPLW
jgi:ABC-type Fe3+/spermidine/putrescine transport system ATPase subunit